MYDDILQQHALVMICPFPNTTDMNALRLIGKYFASTLSYIGILNAFLKNSFETVTEGAKLFCLFYSISFLSLRN